jgi:hypothetical protein
VATITKKYWNSLSKEQQETLINAVSAYNVFTLAGPSFEEFLAVKENTVTLTKEGLRLRLVACFAWGVVVGFVVGGLIITMLS